MNDFWAHSSLPSNPENNAVPQIRVRPSVTGLITPRSSLPSLCLFKPLFYDGNVERYSDGENQQVEQSAVDIHNVDKGYSAENGIESITAVIQQ